MKKEGILFIVEHFPKLSETFVLMEMVGFLRNKRNVFVSANQQEIDVVHEEVRKYNLNKKVRYSSHFTNKSWIQSVFVCMSGLMYDFCTKPATTWNQFWRFAFATRDLIPYSELFHYYNTVRSVQNDPISRLYVPFGSYYNIIRAYIMAKALDVPYIISFRAFDIYKKENLERLLRFKRIIHEAKAIRTISQYNKSYLQRVLKLKNISVIPSPNDSDVFKRSKQLPYNTVPKMVAMGRLVEKKGLIYLVKACKMLKDENIPFECYIVGRGPEQNALQQFIDKHSLPVYFKGALTKKEIKPFLETIDLFVLPCVIAKNGNRDVLPNVVKEGMLMRIPVITTTISGMDEMITHKKNGYLIQPHSAKAVYEACKELFSDRQLYETLSKNSRNGIVKRFSVKVVNKKMDALFFG